MLVGSTGSNFFRFLTCPDWYREKMPLGVAEKTTPIYSGFPRALLWGINPSAPGAHSLPLAWRIPHHPWGNQPFSLWCRGFACLWPRASAHPLSRASHGFLFSPNLYSYLCPFHNCALWLFLQELGFLTQLLPPESRTCTALSGLDL